MPEITSYRDLLVWQRAIDFVDLVYDVTGRLPESERFGLIQQMRKAAVSIPSNIAEGSRHRTAGYVSRVIIALGEHAELETQVIICERRGFVTQENVSDLNGLSRQVGQLAHGLLRSLSARLQSERSQRRRESRFSKPESRRLKPESRPTSRV